MIVITGDRLPVFVLVLDRELTRLVPEENVADLLHQSCMLACFRMCRVQNYELLAARKRDRCRPAGPHILARTGQMIPRFLAQQGLELFEGRNEKLRVPRKLKRV